jgi:3-hydroxyacyl-CoA dehydrogenase
MLKKPAGERLKLLRNSEGPQGQFLWSILRNSFHYAAVHLASIAETARDVDFAMRWGFGMKQGPFELWQEAGWLQVAQWIQEDIEAGKALSKAPLPDWVFSGPGHFRRRRATPGRFVEPDHEKFEPRRMLPVYRRQHFPETVLGSQAQGFETAGKTLHEDEAILLWTLDDQVVIASIKTKMHAISPQVAEGLSLAVDMAEKATRAS